MPEDTEVMTTDEVTTHNGTIRTGDHFHDKRTHNRRWLRVDRIETDRYGSKIFLTVIRAEKPDGTTHNPERETRIAADNLLGREYIRTTADQLPPLTS